MTCAGGLEAAKVADLGAQPGCGQRVDPAHAHQPSRGLRPWRGRHRVRDLALELLTPDHQRQHRAAIVLKRSLRRGLLEPHASQPISGAPASSCLRPLKAHVMTQQQLSITTIGLDPIRRSARDQPRRAHDALGARSGQLAREHEPGRPGFIGRAHRPGQLGRERHDLITDARQPPHPLLAGFAVEHSCDHPTHVHAKGHPAPNLRQSARSPPRAISSTANPRSSCADADTHTSRGRLRQRPIRSSAAPRSWCPRTSRRGGRVRPTWPDLRRRTSSARSAPRPRSGCRSA